MKIRSGFVSNSSSSSFVCQVCGRTESGWDMSRYDADMERCENDHLFCMEHMADELEGLTTEEKKKIWIEDLQESIDYATQGSYLDMLKNRLNRVEYLEGDELEKEFDCGEGADWWYDYSYEVGIPEEQCPICQFYVVSNADMTRYLLKLTGITREEIFAKVKEKNRRRRKLYDTEYVAMVCEMKDINLALLLTTLKAEFGIYKAFLEYCR